MVTISDESRFRKEHDLLRDYLKCDKETLKGLIEHTCSKYPYLDDKSQAVFLLAKEKNLQFEYENNVPQRISNQIPTLDVDLSDYIS